MGRCLKKPRGVEKPQRAGKPTICKGPLLDAGHAVPEPLVNAEVASNECEAGPEVESEPSMRCGPC